MLCVWVYGCDPGRVSDGSRLALYQTLSIECSSTFFWHVYFVILVAFFLSSFVLFLLYLFFSRWSFVDVPLIFFCPADHVPDWQPRILLGMVEVRLVNVKKTPTTTTAFHICFYRWYGRQPAHLLVLSAEVVSSILVTRICVLFSRSGKRENVSK